MEPAGRESYAPAAERLDGYAANASPQDLAGVADELLAVGTLLGRHVSQATDAVAFVLATVVAAIVGGLGPALVAAALSGGLLDFFFTRPYHHLTISEPQSVVALVVMLTVAVLVSLVVDQATRRAKQAAQARTEAALLASYARTVLTEELGIEPGAMTVVS